MESSSKEHELTSRLSRQLRYEVTRTTGEPNCPVGNTGVASMWLKADGHFSTRSAENLVLTISKRSVSGLGASASIVQIVESLVWPFVARRSEKEVWFSDKELNRFVSSMRVTARRLIDVSSEDNREQTFLKFWLDSYLCQVFQDDQRPLRDSWITCPLFSGWLKRFVCRAIARRDVSFIYSLQKGSKRAWPELGEIKKKAALDKHKQRLSESHGYLPSDLEDMVRSTSLEIFKRTNSKPSVTKFLPSGSACLQASRREGGALSLVSRYTLPLESKESKLIGKLPVLNATLNTWRQDQYDAVYAEAVNRMKTVENDGSIQALDVDVVAIPEPGKFRIITKGDGYLYSALQPLQGVMLDDWKACRAATMRDQDLTDKVKSIDRELTELPFWCSVDYEAATDLLKKDATIAVFQPLYNAPLSELAWFALSASGRARYPDGTMCEAIDGQLMGHPLSFPMLCVANLAVYRTAIKRWVRRSLSLDQKRQRRYFGGKMWSNVLVNGDDMLFKCTKDFYPIFVQTALDCGFKMSQGKQYLSPDCCMINSQIFRRSSGVMKRYGYLNLKLIKGVSLKTGESNCTPTQVGKDLSEMVERCLWANCSVPAALSRWKQDWFGPIYRPNWYLPVHLGGFGLNVKFAPPTWKVTESQREMAARFVAEPTMALYRRKGMDIPTAKLAGALARWEMVTGDFVAPEGFDSDLSDRWLERLAYACRAHHGSKDTKDSVFIARFRPQFRLKPMSIEGIIRYWNAQVFAFRTPPCPPIGLIRLEDRL